MSGPTSEASGSSLESADRLVVFTDAVVAIALTLLVLPLVELVPEGNGEHPPLGELLRDNLDRIGAFLLSFVVIFRFWWAHHHLFRHISRLNRAVVAWTLVWTLSIVFLPVPTAIITAYPPSPGAVGLYTGTLLLTSASLTALAVAAYRNPALSAGRPRETGQELLTSLVTVAILVLALVLGTVFAETVNYWALLLMVLTGPIEALVRARLRRRADRRDAGAATSRG